jgi:hypothetical protein
MEVPSPTTATLSGLWENGAAERALEIEEW